MADMTSKERYFAAIAGEMPDRVPIDPLMESKFPMAQIGEKAATFYRDGKKCAEGIIATQRRYGFDIVQLGCTLPQYVEVAGAEWSCPEDGYPMTEAVPYKTIKDIESADIKEIANCQSFKVICEAIKILKDEIGSQVAISCRCPGTFNLVRHLIGTDIMFSSLIENPDLIEKAADLACDLLIQAGIAYREAGADVVWYPDACSSTAFISPQQFEEYAMPRHARFFREMKKIGLLTVYHPDGYEYGVLCQIKSIPGVDAYHMSHNVDLKILRQVYGNDTILYGNIEGQQALLLRKPDEIKMEVASQIKAAGRHGKFIISPNISMPGNTPEINMRAFIDAGKELGVYPIS